MCLNVFPFVEPGSTKRSPPSSFLLGKEGGRFSLQPNFQKMGGWGGGGLTRSQFLQGVAGTEVIFFRSGLQFLHKKNEI